ncbi:MAG: hypothetical protein Q9226_003925 [Calogaya cf. arnoldii]
MDVTSDDFLRLLPSILEAIADAQFVALDLEFSGISNQQKSRLRAPKQHAGGKASLQSRYEEERAAAEKYQVLQLGLTCVGESLHRGVYVVRPYNFNLNPFPDEKMNIQRDVTLQGPGMYLRDIPSARLMITAMQFLYRHNFRIEDALNSGVRYLSREEEAEERRIEAQLRDKDEAPLVQLDPNDIVSLEFMHRVRQEVMTWKSRSTVKTPEFLNIAPIGHGRPPYPERGLNGFQRLLVHQYVKTEHPDLTTTTRQGFVQITARNPGQQDAQKQYRTKVSEERIARQVGLRWLIEAIHGADLSAINPDSLIPADENKKASMISHFNSLRSRLKGQSTVLVGHNLFLDLIYLYACFFGPLPDRVEDFQRIIHSLFPRIIDTKYLATHDDPDTAGFNLEELDRMLHPQAQPVIELHPGHIKYAAADSTHEAGFDSFLTARLLLRSSVSIEASGRYAEELPSPVEDAFYTPPEGEGDDLIDFKDATEQLEQIDKISSESSSRPSSSVATSRTNFSHITKFDLLGDLADEIDPFTLRPKTPGVVNEPKPEPEPKIDNETGRRLPAWENDFWKVYGNKLQVNGTLEGVCDLGLWPQ